jgi:hypothetical protein
VPSLTSPADKTLQVEEAHIQCTDEERDEVLYYILAK